MSVYCNNFIFDETSDEYILFHEPGDSYQSWQGLRGPYYTPSVDPIGNLSWTNNGNLPNPATVNVSGRGITLKGVCATTADLPADPEDGEAWAVGVAYPYECYVWFENSWVDMGPLLPKGDPGEGVPAGGTTGQVLKKASNADYDTEWGTGGGTQVQADWTQANPTDPSYIQHKPTIPAAQVQSDWNQADNTQVDYIKNKPTIPAAQVNSDWDAVSGVAQILNKPLIPVIDNTLSNTGEAADAKATGDKITDVEKITSYVENGNTASRNYTAGEYITWKGVAYYAKTNISSGASFVVDTNLTAVGDKGIANDLKNSFDSLGPTSWVTLSNNGSTYGHYRKFGSVVNIVFSDSSASLTNGAYLGSLDAGYIPSQQILIPVMDKGFLIVNTNGTITASLISGTYDCRETVTFIAD